MFLNHLMGICSKDSKGLYSLINRDIDVHNILIDNDFNIVGVIDFDGVFAAQPGATAQYLKLSCMDVESPGIVETSPHALERVELCAFEIIFEVIDEHRGL
ncbi:hypothetical protein F4782DRAFT_535780 [Xylaria castorea]|nr:hypothetical protein F4782DRAFT_535780 [Xylaria castorea]